MPFTMTPVAGKDGNGTLLPGGLLAADVAGGGAGPWFLFHGIVDGVAGANRAQVTGSNALKVDGSAVTQPVSIAAGATTIGKTEDSVASDQDVGVPAMAIRQATPANSSSGDGDYEFLKVNAGRLWVDASGVSLTVASHAVTNAGTFAVQESGGALTALQLIDDIITAQGTALGTTKTGLMGGSVTTSAPTYVSGQISPLSLDTSGALRVTGGGGGTQYVEDDAAAANPTGSMLMSRRRDTPTASEVSADGDNIASIATNKGKIWTAAELRVGDALVAVGNGAADAATPRMSIATDSQTPTVANNADGVAASGSLLTIPVVSYLFGWNGATYDRLQSATGGILKVQVDSSLADDAAFTFGTTRITVSGFVADETSTDSVDENDAGAARMTLDRKQIVTAQPHSQGGALALRKIDLDETPVAIKNARGNLYGFNLVNRVASARFVRFYNVAAASVVVGTTAPYYGPVEIPGAANGDHTAMIVNFPVGIEFDTAISWAATTGLADNDTGAPATNDIIGIALYK